MIPTHFEAAASTAPSVLGTTKAGDSQTGISQTCARTTFPREDAAEMRDIHQGREIATELAKIRQGVVAEYDLKCARSVEERKRAEQIMAEMGRDSDLGRHSGVVGGVVVASLAFRGFIH